MNVSTSEPGVVTTPVACALLMLTQPRLSALERDGWISRLAPNRWRIVDLVQGYVKFLKDEERRTSKTATLGRVQEARARQIERKNLIAEGRLMETETVMAIFNEVFGLFASRLEGFPAQITRDPVMRLAMKTGLDQIRTEAADRMAARAAEHGAKAAKG